MEKNRNIKQEYNDQQSNNVDEDEISDAEHKYDIRGRKYSDTYEYDVREHKNSDTRSKYGIGESKDSDPEHKYDIRGRKYSDPDEVKNHTLTERKNVSSKANTTVSAAATVNYMEYIIQPGDTFWAISRRHGISLDELTVANPNVDPNIIWPGLVILIPVKVQESEPPIELPVEENQKQSLTYLFGANAATYLSRIEETKDSIKTVVPDYFDIDANGDLLITPSGKIDPAFISELHKKGIKIVPFISNHWDRPLGIKALENRQNLSTQIAETVLKYDLDGIDVDIENTTHEHKAMYTDFIRLLREKLPKDKIVSVAVAANPYGWTTGWHGCYDYKALAEHCDYLMIMSYDESYTGSSAGPVSSAAFFEKSIQYALNQGVPKAKIISGMPFYGRYWKQDAAVGGSGISVSDVKYLIANYQSTVRYDTARESANATVTITDNDVKPVVWGGRVLTEGVYDIWYDDLRAVEWKLNLVNEYGLRGAGSWALGQEDTDIWEFYTNALNGVTPEPITPEPEIPEQPEIIPDPVPEAEPEEPVTPQPPVAEPEIPAEPGPEEPVTPQPPVAEPETPTQPGPQPDVKSDNVYLHYHYHYYPSGENKH